jgi:glucokinase
MKQNIYIGADIGGTSIKLAFISESGEMIDNWEVPTDIANNGENIPNDITNSVREKLAFHQFSIEQVIGMGAGAPGYVDVNTGMVFEAVNIGWKNVNLREKLSSLLDVPVFVMNDANLAVLGEHWLGAGRHSDHLIAVTLGTGVGGGILVNGQVINGVSGTGGEIGHIIVTPNEGPICNCGRKGCIETYASATGIANQGLEAIRNGEYTSLGKTFERNQTLSSKDIFEHANEGDSVSIKIIDKTTNLLGLMLANLSLAINPGVIIIGGGVSQAGDFLLSKIEKSFHDYVIEQAGNACEVVIAQLGNQAGVIGAAYLVKQNIK